MIPISTVKCTWMTQRRDGNVRETALDDLPGSSIIPLQFTQTIWEPTVPVFIWGPIYQYTLIHCARSDELTQGSGSHDLVQRPPSSGAVLRLCRIIELWCAAN